MFKTLPALAFIALTTALMGCDGETGPVGAAGPAGQDGSDGSNGQNGTNGSDGADGEDGQVGENGTPGFGPGIWWVATNGADNAGEVTKRASNWDVLATFTTETNEGIDFDAMGNLVQAGDSAGNVGLRTFCASPFGTAAFSDDRDRAIEGAATGLTNPKGIVVAERAGLIMVADVGDSTVKVFGSQAAGDNAPIMTIDLAQSAWDLAYDDVNDRLFLALTNGTIGVIDNVTTGGADSGLTRVITPTDGSSAVGVNIHGIDYNRSLDMLVVTDVGGANADQSADFASDGAIYVFSEASMADGMVEPDRTIAGDATLLGNPVDLVLDGTSARVAEKTQGKLLVFSNIFAGDSGDIAPDYMVDVTAPESIAMMPMVDYATNASDIIDPFTPLRGVYYTTNPGDDADNTDEGIVRLATRSLNASQSAFLLRDDAGDEDDNTGAVSIENITVGTDGTAYATFDTPPGGGGIAIIADPSMRDAGEYSSAMDRAIVGANTGITSPKGLEVVDEFGIILVADFGTDAATAGIHVFSSCAAGDVPPLTTVDTGDARPWDIHHDFATDTLYAAFTNGEVGVYENFSVTLGAEGPDRTIIPVDDVGDVVSVNLHSVRYDLTSDSLILADVGLASSNTDGALFVIPFASTADGESEVSINFSGTASGLGNPVDIAFDGRDLYVAEKANAGIYLYRDFLTVPRDGGLFGAGFMPDFTLPAVAAESVVLAPM